MRWMQEVTNMAGRTLAELKDTALGRAICRTGTDEVIRVVRDADNMM